MNEKIKKTIEIFNDGGIVIFPTDTAFGIGCRLDKIDTIKRLFKIRQRPNDMAMPILVSSVKMAERYSLEIDESVIEKLIKPYWPGALTIVTRCNKDKVPSLVRGGKETVGIRMPANSDILTVIESLGVAILGSSANFHGKNTPFETKDLDPELVRQVDYVLEGECSLKKTSTVIDTTDNPWKILRQGAIEVKIS